MADDSEMQNLIGAIDEQDFNFLDDEDGTPYQFRINGVTISYENLQREYWKVHKKIPKNLKRPEDNGKASWMRVKDGNVRIAIEANGIDCRNGMVIAKVVVQRERAAYEEARQMNDGHNKYIGGEVSLTYVAKQEGSKWILDVDLDSVYNAVEDTKLKEVYALCPSNIEATNKFQLVTELYLRRENEFGEETDRLVGKKESKPFLLRTEPRTHRASASPGTPESGQWRTPSSPGDATRGYPECENGIPDAKFDNLEANSALIGTLNANIIKTGNRDIGYHIPLKELGQKGELNEGDVVGFFEDENQKSAIERLNKENYSRAKLAGVITRSYYVEGLCPEALLGHSDLVCVIGIVKVRVLGMVRNGEQLYAYKKVPGVAATSSRLAQDKKEENGKTFLIGQALESRINVDFDEESLVSAFVSVVNGIDCLAMNQQVESMNEYFRGMIRHLVFDATKKIKRRFFWLKLLLLIALVTIGLALWQRYAPNTLLRQSLCKRGCYKERTMVLSFKTPWQEIKFTALEFKFKTLKEKIHHGNKLISRGEKYRYFINYERCKNRGVSYGNEYVDDTPTVSGPEILSSDKNCTLRSLKYFNNDKWMRLMTRGRSVRIINCYGSL